MRRWERLRDRIAQNRWLELEYERATAQPQEMLERIYGFLGLPFDLEAFGDGLACYKAVHIGQWREELPDIDTQISSTFRGALRRFRYESAAVVRLA
jgi:hypothetical protein